MSTIKDIKLSNLKLLIPKTQADLLHVTICYGVYLTFVHYFTHSGIALAITIGVAIAKELNDKFGFIKSLLSNPDKKTTDADGLDLWMGIIIPLILTILNYTNVI